MIGKLRSNNALGCRKESFPQTYLRLPLSTTKLKLSAFAPQIAKCDNYAGWQTSLLNHMGRTTLVNSVLDCQLVYPMVALAIPPGVIDQIDKRRRSFGMDPHKTMAQKVWWPGNKSVIFS